MKHLFADAFLENSSIKDEVENNINLYRKGEFSLDLSSLTDKNIRKITIKQTNHYFKFGCAIFMLDGYDTEQKNQLFKEKFLNLFNLGVIDTFWRDYEPEKGVYRFNKESSTIYRRPLIDAAFEFCRENGLYTKAHNLILASRDYAT